MVPAETCTHLVELERALRLAGFAVEFDGPSWWSSPARGRSVYFRCTLDQNAVRERYQLPEFVAYSEWDGRAAGHEAGFYCGQCESAVVGGHPAYGGSPFPEIR